MPIFAFLSYFTRLFCGLVVESLRVIPVSRLNLFLFHTSTFGVGIPKKKGVGDMCFYMVCVFALQTVGGVVVYR